MKKSEVKETSSKANAIRFLFLTLRLSPLLDIYDRIEALNILSITAKNA